MLGCIYAATIDGGRIRISLVLPFNGFGRTQRINCEAGSSSTASCGVWGARIPLNFEEK